MPVKLSQQIAKHIREVHFGGNWSSSDLKGKLTDVTWQQAVAHVGDFHTIAVLVFHMNYYVEATIGVLQGEALECRDRYSFDAPPIESQQEWEALLTKTWADAESFASLVEELPEHRFWDDFVDSKFGNYYRCTMGLVEHCHYHLGQIVLIKKLLADGVGVET